MGAWEFFKKKNDEKEQKEGPKGNLQFGNPKVEKNPYFYNLIPTPEQIDSAEAYVPLNVSKLILSSSIPDHKIGSIILSNIFLIPKNMKEVEDSWPYYHDSIETNKKIQLELIDRKCREDIRLLKGKGKRIKAKYYNLLKRKKHIIQNYYEEYEKTLSLSIQKIRVEIIPLEREISETKYKLNDSKQKLIAVKTLQLEKIKEYNHLLDSNIKSLTKIKDAIKNILSLKKIWQASHIVASYIVAFFGASEIVKTEQFRQFIREKTAKLAVISDFINSNFILVQSFAAALIFLATVGLYDKFVIDFIKRRSLKREISELVKKEKEYDEEIKELERKISELKEERKAKVKNEIYKTEKDLEFLYENYKENASEIDTQICSLLKSCG
ncbi:MAG: hypothetical protein NZ903_01180 [Candidatus Micrarchaeota archaeon]|nr:hypothetical protein [Candidatus Micrarchaeota archaeon]